MKGLFITFEGFEGSGKSTHIKLLANFLKNKGRSVLVLHEPGSTKVGEEIRRILLDKNNKRLLPKAELLLYLAVRAQLVQEKIAPSLKAGRIVLCDRFHDATVAYQGYGLGLDTKMIESLRKFVTGGISPDLTILLDIDIKEGLRRAGRKDRIEARSYS
jgi:dTMP kinase